jgi:hypothetical protein
MIHSTISISPHTPCPQLQTRLRSSVARKWAPPPATCSKRQGVRTWTWMDITYFLFSLVHYTLNHFAVYWFSLSLLIFVKYRISCINCINGCSFHGFSRWFGRRATLSRRIPTATRNMERETRGSETLNSWLWCCRTLPHPSTIEAEPHSSAWTVIS